MTTVSGDWLSAPATQRVFAVIEAAGHRAYAVGGCVRNALMGVPVSDVDIASDARPEEIVRLSSAAGLKPVPTGIEHGTVTVVSGGIPHEITTFRADVETDGRRAVIRYSTEIAEDAARRDFTMNALYADARGRLLDPLDGLPDLQARRVRFIGAPVERIHEDYLRILRYFRFMAWYGDPQGGFDAEALAGIAACLDGLGALSRERVGQELTKLLSAPEPAPSVGVMAQLGVLSRVLPGAVSEPLAPLVAFEQELHLSPDPMRRLAVLGFFDGAALRMSRAQQKRLGLYQSLISDPAGLAEIAYRHGSGMARDVALLRAASFGAPLQPGLEAEIASSAGAVFPVKPRDLMPDYQGPALGERLRLLEERWIASGFALSREELLRA